MNILVIGSGGREHVLCWKIKQSEQAGQLFCAPGNGGTAEVARNVDLDISDHGAVSEFCARENIELVVVGPELPLATGITDDLAEKGITVFGPSHAASRLESSKIYAKEAMARFGVPTASFRIFDDHEKCLKYLRTADFPLVIKANGLAAGKGVFVCGNLDEAASASKMLLEEDGLGRAGSKLIVEECLEGEEVSVLVLTDGKKIVPLATSQDHKRAGEADTGPNTGGMGAYSPAPVLDDALFEEIISTVIRPTIEGLRSEGIEYRGVLYAGIMVTASGPKVLEFNVRFGDPEAQAILPRMKSDILPYLMGAASGELADAAIEWDERPAVCVVLASGGYPGAYEKGYRITGTDRAKERDALVFHAGTQLKGDELVTAGGRVLGVVALEDRIDKACAKAYAAIDEINFENMYYRKDIAHRALARAL